MVVALAEELNALLRAAAKGDQNAFTRLTELYDPLIRSMSARFASSASAGEDVVLSVQDLEQESRLALYRAAVSFDPEQKNVSFGLYAKICIRNALVSALRRRSASKHPGRVVSHVEKDTRRSAPELSSLLEASDLTGKIGEILSPYENKVFELYISGRSVKSISLSVGRSEKSVSNAVYRIRIKMKGLLEKLN